MKVARVLGVADKELSEAMENRYLQLLAVAPLLVISGGVPALVLGLGRMQLLGNVPAAYFHLPGRWSERLQGLSPAVQVEVVLLTLLVSMLLIMVIAIPVSMSVYSVVGEKLSRCLEPLLATPLATEELLAGKALAAVVAGVAVMMAGYGIMLLTVLFMGVSAVGFAAVWGPAAWVQVGLVGPLLGMGAALIGLVISSRVSDVRLAEQLGLLLLFPVMGIVSAQLTGLAASGFEIGVATAAVLVPVDGLLLWIAVRVFDRDTILTRWK